MLNSWNRYLVVDDFVTVHTITRYVKRGLKYLFAHIVFFLCIRYYNNYSKEVPKPKKKPLLLLLGALCKGGPCLLISVKDSSLSV